MSAPDPTPPVPLPVTIVDPIGFDWWAQIWIPSGAGLISLVIAGAAVYIARQSNRIAVEAHDAAIARQDASDEREARLRRAQFVGTMLSHIAASPQVPMVTPDLYLLATTAGHGAQNIVVWWLRVQGALVNEAPESIGDATLRDPYSPRARAVGVVMQEFGRRSVSWVESGNFDFDTPVDPAEVDRA